MLRRLMCRLGMHGPRWGGHGINNQSPANASLGPGYRRCTHCGADGPSVYGEMGAAPTIARARSMWNGRAEYLKTPNGSNER